MSTRTTHYSDRSRERTTHATAVDVQRWLSGPMTRLMMPKKKRVQVEVLAAYIVERLAPIEHLTYAPPVDSLVRLIKDDTYLRERHEAVIGSIGRVVAHSHLSEDDNGILVDWGNPDGRVRCSLDELALVVDEHRL